YSIDFNGTLFKSPQPNTQIWDDEFMDNTVVKNWCQDEKSLGIDEDPILSGRWSVDELRYVHESMPEQNSLNVLLSGCNFLEFHEVLTKIVENKGQIDHERLKNEMKSRCLKPLASSK
ncbi:16740_t:CDS:2, partial [Dentiscutata heterogama]